MLVENYIPNDPVQNEFRHKGEEFYREFHPHDEHVFIAYKIYHLLIDHPDRAYNRYADRELSIEEVCQRIRDDVYELIPYSPPFVRSLVRAFCSHGGVYRPQLEELLSAYFIFIDKSRNPNF